MKILFVAPEQGISSKNSTPVPPAALLYIAGLTPDDIEVELIDMTYESIDYEKKYDLVAISIMTLMSVRAYEVADIFRKLNMKVVVGGHHPTAMPLEAKLHADVVVIGEAEYIWEKVIRDYQAGKLYDFYIGGHPGTFLNKDLPGKVYKDERIPDLINVPHMRRSLLEKKSYKNKYIFDVMYTTKGCPYNCKFCSVTKFFGTKIRHRPIKDVIKELHNVGNYFLLSDDNCYFPTKYFSELFEAINKEFKDTKKWYSHGSLSIVNERNADFILEKAVKAGQMAVFIGLESVNPESVKEVNAYSKMGYSKEEINLEHTRKAIRKFQSHGIMVWAFLILGFLNDTPDTFKETINFLDETKVLPLPISLCPLPGTDLWVEFRDIMLPNKTWDMWDGGHSLYKHPNFTPEQFEETMNKFRIELYNTKRILRRLAFNKLRYLPMNIAVEFGMKKSFKDVYKAVLKDQELAKNIIK